MDGSGPGAVKIPQTRSTPVVVPAGTFDDVVPPESGSSWRVHPVEVGRMWSLGMRAETNDGHDVARSMWRLRPSIHNPSRLHRASARIECGFATWREHSSRSEVIWRSFIGGSIV